MALGCQKSDDVTRDLIRDLEKPVDHQKAKREVSCYNREYQAHKMRGSEKGFRD